jgi:hypothetical protein
VILTCFRRLIVPILAGTWLLAAAVGGPVAAGLDPVRVGFQEVPPEARLRMFWRIFGPAWSREEIDRQLEQLQRAGVGGVMTCFTYPLALDDPASGIENQAFLSPAFLDTFRYAAVRSKQLGLEFGVCGGTGWPFGGPSVSLRDAAQRLRAVAATAEGDSFVLPKLREGERYLAAFCGSRDVTAFIREDRLRIPGEGQASLPACQVFIAGPTFMKVKRPSLGGEGYVVDHFSRGAARRYMDTVAAPMLQAAPDDLLRTLFCDSLEVYRANWTHDFPAQFLRRRGYDLIPHLPALFAENQPDTPDLRFDFWRTAVELTEQEFARTVYAWCRKRGVTFALEPYGTPSMGLTSGRQCDVPWGEQYEWKGFSFSRFAASAGHLAGRQVIGAEAWTWTGIPNRLADSLSDLKLCSDLHFLSGENELTGVDFPYSPRSAGAPGWLPYYGPVMSPNNPQWLCFPEFAAYINRCQWLLRQGKPVADVALYTPTEDILAGAPTEQLLLDFQLRDRLANGALTDEFGLEKAFRHHSDVIHTILSSGYNFDGIDFFAVNEIARVRGGRLVAGHGRYSIVVLPNLIGMEPAALEKIARFCRDGGTVIATRRLPDRVYGLRGRADNPRLQALLGDMFGPGIAGSATTVRRYGRGKAIFAADEREALAAALSQSGTPPDLRVSVVSSEASTAAADLITHVHRRVGQREIFFIVNLNSKKAQFEADFRLGRGSPSLWDPMTGRITPLPALASDRDRTRVALTLPPRGSTFICLEKTSSTAPAPSTPVATAERPLEVSWRVTFAGPDAPPPHETRDLASWTGWPGARYFSGEAAYAGSFECAPEPGARYLLRFDRVHEVARVRVNGQAAGAAWTPAYEVEITPFLRRGANRLEVTVANLPVNRVLGLPDPDLRPLRAVYGERFPDPEEKKLMAEPAPSGLVGSVMLITLTEPASSGASPR